MMIVVAVIAIDLSVIISLYRSGDETPYANRHTIAIVSVIAANVYGIGLGLILVRMRHRGPKRPH